VSSDLIEQLKNEFMVKKVYKWNGYVDDGREKEVVAIIEEVARNTMLVPSFLGTIAIGEGMGLWIDANYDPVPPHMVRMDQEIDGYERLGVDHFTADFQRTKKYLPADFNEGDEFKLKTTNNELGNRVQSAIFKNLKSGIQALGATVRLRRDTFRRAALALGYTSKVPATPEQEAFWIYVYFQGEGRAASYLRSNGSLDYAKAAPVLMREVRKLALERAAAWKFIQSKALFSS
jgi:hypothetical protein